MARPTYASAVPSSTDVSTAHRGAALLGLPLIEAGERIAGLLEARNRNGSESKFTDVVIQAPRRATKTTAIWATILGRAATREGYRCVVTAQSGTTASRILLDHAEMMLAHGMAQESREGRDSALPTVYRNGGREHIDFPETHGRIWVVPPDPGAVRSAAADDTLIDEAGEHDPSKFDALMEGIRPLRATRSELGQIIVTGTPGKVRAGPFWTMLEDGRNHRDKQLGILDWSIRDSEDAEDRKVWKRVHPGPSSRKPDGKVLVPMKFLEREFGRMGPVSFAREYLARWPFDNTVSAIDPEEWKAREVASVVPPPWCAVAADCEPNGMAAAIALAWREDGVPVVAIADYRPGTTWVAAAVRAIRERHPRVPVAIDRIGANTPVVEELERGTGRRRVDVITPGFKSMMGAAQTLVSRLPNHQGQPDLERAVAGATWREVEGGRLFARKRSGVDVSPLVAASAALWAYDNRPQRPRIGIISSSDTRAE